MGPGLFLIAILGCGEDDAACREVEVVAPRYQSDAACAAATPQMLERYAGLAFPNVVAQCRPVGARPALLRGSDVMPPAPRPAPPPRFAGLGRVRSFR